MAIAGDTIECPLSGVRTHSSSRLRATTKGQLFQLDDVMQGGGRVPIEDVHPYMEERFEILLSGSAPLSMRAQGRDVGAGERVVVAAGTPQVWGNPSEEDVHLILEFRPALRIEE
jgi:mannose-6-phosphate isomerase-like protein (cupin superfamily)